ncbi:(d)CMP kinase [Gammaproteobacteria bacterium]|nr:(d)CMP kinase [SAR86 cluster bacterium]MBL6822298.1 (d)CMP kinase [SAR86 cluster bacterium]MDA9800026.1 (d)CMP kinase [Gammaproteobacteria bacterium]MDB2370119.1 (d)CMP kinase [Gammaproteobacteria bacterium]MDB2411435.1 (d)CMP kinase [Gammaproteobacteria bacterium]
MKNNNIITIDGPSASGKGSLAKALAKELNFILLDSGLLYRAYSYCFDQSQNHSTATELFANLKIDSFDREMHVFEKNKDITSILRHENIAKSASKLSSLKETRANLISFQRDLASNHGLVADGRDMGTVVFPDAGTKIFLVADAEVRAKRRFLELQNAGQGVNMRDLIDDIRLRDEADKAREISPLIPADDSIEVNSSNLNPQEVLEIVLKIYKENTKEV